MPEVKETEYVWKSNSRVKLDANRTGDYIEGLKVKFNGTVTPEQILKEASKRNSYIRSHFEWDDKTAAHEHRLEQARHLLMSLEVQYTFEDREPIRIRAYFPKSDRSGYVSAEDILDDPEERDKLIAKAYKELMSWKRKYENLEEFSTVIRHIEKVKV